MPIGFNLPRSLSYNHMNWATVTDTGTRITVPKSTVTLTIPQGAVMPGRTQDIYAAIVDKHKPPMVGGHTPLTPVTQWGSSTNRKLLKPVVLSIPHASFANLNTSKVRIFHCPDLEADNAEWNALNNTSDNLQIDPSHCHLVIDKEGAYVIMYLNNDQLSPLMTSQTSCMSNSTKQALCRCLDVPTCQGNDWRKLAEVIGVNNYSAHFANQPSPSEAILNLWESRNNIKDNHTALVTLAQLLKDISRLDAVVILERELKK